jgi:hypothetical protein
MPPGVPAGGIFGRNAPGPGGGQGTELPLDTVAADLPSLGPATVAPTALAASARGVPLIPAATMLGPGPARPALAVPTNSAPVAAPTGTAGRPGWERAELPDIVALGSIAAPPRPSSDPGGSVDAGRSSAVPMSNLSIRPRDTAMAAGGSDRPGRTLVLAGTGASVEASRDEQRVGVGLAIYGAASLTIRGSQPELTSMLRGRERDGDAEA